MTRKIVLAAALCVAVAALGIGTAPALAADGCTCHTLEPPTAPTPHAPFVASVTDCTTCHVGWTVPHPEAVEPALTARLAVYEFFYAATGGLSIPWVPLAGVTVYPQMKAPAATDWTTLEPLFGDDRIATDGVGTWFRMVGAGTVGPPVGTIFRAISQGVAGPPVVMPAISGPFKRPVPTITLRLRGLSNGALASGHAVTARGAALPRELIGQKVQLRVQRGRYGATHITWHRIGSFTRIIGSAGDFSWRYTPKERGQYRVRAFINATSAYRAATTGWRQFRVM
jgi:hypothetical protein